MEPTAPIQAKEKPRRKHRKRRRRPPLEAKPSRGSQLLTTFRGERSNADLAKVIHPTDPPSATTVWRLCKGLQIPELGLAITISECPAQVPVTAWYEDPIP